MFAPTTTKVMLIVFDLFYFSCVTAVSVNPELFVIGWLFPSTVDRKSPLNVDVYSRFK